MTTSDRDLPFYEYQIRTVLVKFADLADGAQDVAQIAELFAADATLRMGSDAWRGRPDIASCLSGMRVHGGVGPGSRKVHVLTNVSVHFTDRARATARSRFLLIDASAGPPTIVVTGQYLDALHCTNDEWLIADREIVVN